jgi:hypothetical protein
MNTDKFNELLIRVNPCYSVALSVRVVPWLMSQETDVARWVRSMPRYGSTFTRAAPKDNHGRTRMTTDQDNHGLTRKNTDNSMNS